METLFDDFIIGSIMQATGADEVSARFMLALHRGVISGDVHIDGQDFTGTPFVPVAAKVKLTAPAWTWAIVTGSLQGGTATHSISFTPDFERFSLVA